MLILIQLQQERFNQLIYKLKQTEFLQYWIRDFIQTEFVTRCFLVNCLKFKINNDRKESILIKGIQNNTKRLFDKLTYKYKYNFF